MLTEWVEARDLIAGKDLRTDDLEFSNAILRALIDTDIDQGFSP